MALATFSPSSPPREMVNDSPSASRAFTTALTAQPLLPLASSDDGSRFNPMRSSGSLSSRRRTRRLRCYVCDGKWSDEEFRLKQREFNNWNPERAANHRVYLNEQQTQHLRSFFTPAGELAVLCRQHLREYAAIGTTVLKQIQHSVMRVADVEIPASTTAAARRRRGGHNKIERAKPEVIPFFRQWIDENTHSNPATCVREFRCDLSSKGAAHRKFNDDLGVNHTIQVSWPSFLRLLKEYAPDISVI